jgi:hypothetical protein
MLCILAGTSRQITSDMENGRYQTRQGGCRSICYQTLAREAKYYGVPPSRSVEKKVQAVKYCILATYEPSILCMNRGLHHAI